MRQRKLKHLETRMQDVSRWILQDALKKRGRWKEFFGNDNDIYVEIGCGKGRFISSLAYKYPKRNFIAVEVQPSALVRAAEKADIAGHKNLIFVGMHLKSLDELFEEGEIKGVYLNFSDPWPKARHEKRRLTHRNYLIGYRDIVKPGGFLEFKTDNVNLYDFTLEELKEMDMKILEMSRDLHSSPYESKEVMTEYEEKFILRDMKINYVKALLKMEDIY